MQGKSLSYSHAQKVRVETFARLAKNCIKQHPGEEGRVLEGIVAGALREFLPRRFSMGTGFAVNSAGRQSKQLDIVIYDHEQNAPIMFDNDVGVFPIESIYAAIEVKTTFRRRDIKTVVEGFEILRQMSDLKHYVLFKPKEVGPGRYVAEAQRVHIELAPRTFVFALATEFTGPLKLNAALQRGVRARAAHVHGLCVLNADCIFSQVAYGNGRFVFQQGAAFRRFCRSVVDSVNSIQMLPAWMEDYVTF